MIPEILSSHSMIQRINTFVGLTGHELHPAPGDDTEIDISLRLYTDRIKKSGVFEGLVRGETDDPDFDIRALSLRYAHGTGLRRADPHDELMMNFGEWTPAQFLFDGKYGYILSDKNTGYGVCATFDMFSSPSAKREDDDYSFSGELLQREIIIKQLQGPLVSWKDERVSNNMPARSELIDNLRWEFVLIDLISLWARNSGFARIFLLPVDLNWEFNRKSGKVGSAEKYERGKLRYDHTAKRIGFKEHPSGYMVRDLEALRPEFDRGLLEMMFGDR